MLQAEAYPPLCQHRRDNGGLGLDFDDESSTDDSELPWAASHSCMYCAKYYSSTPRTPQLIASCSIQPAGHPSCPITKVLNQHTPTTVYSPNDNSLPQIHTLFVPPIWVIPALLHLLPPSPIHSSSSFPHESGRLPRGIDIRFHDFCRSLYCRFRERLPTFFRVRPHHAWLLSRPLVAGAGSHSVHVCHRFLTRSLFAPRSY